MEIKLVKEFILTSTKKKLNPKKNQVNKVINHNDWTWLKNSVYIYIYIYTGQNC